MFLDELNREFLILMRIELHAAPPPFMRANAPLGLGCAGRVLSILRLSIRGFFLIKQP